jgi:hypothetical protein
MFVVIFTSVKTIGHPAIMTQTRMIYLSFTWLCKSSFTGCASRLMRGPVGHVLQQYTGKLFKIWPAAPSYGDLNHTYKVL